MTLLNKFSRKESSTIEQVQVPLYRLELVREKDLEFAPKIKSVEAAASIFHQLLDNSPQEKMAVLHCNSEAKLIGAEIVSVGSMEMVRTELRDVFKGALVNHASGIWLAHNHPTGSVQASPQDFMFTEGVLDVADKLGIHLQDHLVIVPGKHFSIRENMEKFHRSGYGQPRYMDGLEGLLGGRGMMIPLRQGEDK